MRREMSSWIPKVLGTRKRDGAYDIDPMEVVRRFTNQKIIVVYEHAAWMDDVISGMVDAGLAFVIIPRVIILKHTGCEVCFIDVDSHEPLSEKGDTISKIYYEPSKRCRLVAQNIDKELGNPRTIHPLGLALDESLDVCGSNPQLDEFLDSYRASKSD